MGGIQFQLDSDDKHIYLKHECASNKKVSKRKKEHLNCNNYCLKFIPNQHRHKSLLKKKKKAHENVD